MKPLIFSFAFLLFTISLFAQITLASYSLNTTDGGVAVSSQYVSASDFTSSGTGTLTFGAEGAYANNWPTTNSLTAYFEISLSPATGYKLNISEIDFGERRSSTGIRNYEVRWSTDNYTTYQSNGVVNVPDDNNERTGDITGLNITVDDGETIKIRWYAYDAEGTTGTWRINDNTLKILGTISNSGTNDQDTKAEAPTTQIGNTTVASTVQSEANAVDVFKFKISDQGTADGKPTKVTLIKIKKNSGSLLLDDWIAGFVLKDGGTSVPIASVSESTTGAYFDLNINSGDLEIADGTSKELTLGIYLEPPLTDNASFSFFIDADDNGFAADTLGSGFDTDFGTDITSSTITIEVTATKLLCDIQPTATVVNSVMSPSPMVSYVDADNNVDEDISGASYAVTISSSGTLDGSTTTTVNPTSGKSTFTDVKHTVAEKAVQLTFSSASSSYSSISSNYFNITNATLSPAVDSLYISEVSDAGNVSSEYLELYNPSVHAIDLSSVTLYRMDATTGSDQYSKALSLLVGDLVIDSNSYLIISRGADRATFESDWSSSLPSNAGFLQGNDKFYFGAPTQRRWRIDYDDGSKGVTTIDDTQGGVGGNNNTSNQTTPGTWVTSAYSSNSTPGYGNPDSELPVELLSFEAGIEKGRVKLLWQTASEMENDYFVVERSSNAKDFEEIVIVGGAGNSNVVRSYTYIDVNPDANIVYYRLKMVDFNGDYTYSRVLSVRLQGKAVQLTNKYMENGSLVLNINCPESAILQLRILSVNGQEVYNEQLQIKRGNRMIRIPLESLASGMYIMQLSGNNFIESEKILIR